MEIQKIKRNQRNAGIVLHLMKISQDVIRNILVIVTMMTTEEIEKENQMIQCLKIIREGDHKYIYLHILLDFKLYLLNVLKK
jgi:hypothetical protein